MSIDNPVSQIHEMEKDMARDAEDLEKLSDENRFIRSEAFRWRQERDAAVNQLLDMRAQRDSLAERLRGSPEMREVVSELRQMLRDLDNDLPGHSRRRLERLLRRLDESPNTTTTP